MRDHGRFERNHWLAAGQGLSDLSVDLQPGRQVWVHGFRPAVGLVSGAALCQRLEVEQDLRQALRQLEV